MSTKNWKDNLTEEDFHKFDIAVSEILQKILEKSSIKKKIRLWNFDMNDKSHMLVLRVALIARDFYSYPIEVEHSIWSHWKLNRKLRKHFKKVKRYHMSEDWPSESGIHVPTVARHSQCDDFSLADVYEVYYEGSLD